MDSQFLLAAFLVSVIASAATSHWVRRQVAADAQRETMRRRAKKREAIKALVAQLRKIESDYSHDPEELRLRANGAVAGLLVQLGCTDVVDVWEWITCQKK